MGELVMCLLCTWYLYEALTGGETIIMNLD